MFRTKTDKKTAELLLGRSVKKREIYCIISDEWGVRLVGNGRFYQFNYRELKQDDALKEFNFGKRN